MREARRRAKGQARIMIVEVSERRAIDASASADPLRYTNHSCAPNAALRIRQGRVEIYALRDIAAGEEIAGRLRREPPRGAAALPLRRAVLRRAAVERPRWGRGGGAGRTGRQACSATGTTAVAGVARARPASASRSRRAMWAMKRSSSEA